MQIRLHMAMFPIRWWVRGGVVDCRNCWMLLTLVVACLHLVSRTAVGAVTTTTSSSVLGDPYEILGVGKSATTKEIRKAYKNLAVVWHPDKNKVPEAEEQFVKINRAYELLSDPARRRLYDQRGVTEDSPNFNPRPDYTTFNRFDPIDEILTFTTGGAFHYPFADGIAFLHKQSITAKTFEQNVMPKSFTVPQLILFYGDWCSGCTRVASIWRTISDQLTNIGIDVSCVHADRETAVARKIGIKVIPSVVLVLDSHAYHYRDTVVAANKVTAFIRSKLPFDLLVPLDKETVEDFLGNWWRDNRIRVIIVGTSEVVRLRYQVLAFHFRERAAFGYVTTEDKDFNVFRQNYGIPDGMDSIFVFKELEKPVASLSMTEISQKLMSDLVENNKFLILPRLSSQTVMDTICPTETSLYRRRLCVVFLTRKTKILEDEDSAKALREYALRQGSSVRVKFAYLYGEVQRDFVSSLSGSKKDSNLMIIWRQTSSKISYEWIEGGWDGTNTSAQRLDSILHRLITEKTSLSYQVEVKELTDEHAQGFLFKVLRKVSLTMEFVRAQVTREMVIQTASVIATVLFIVAGGFIMAYLVRLEEESILAKAKADAQRSPPSSNSRPASSTTTENPTPLQLLTQNPECRIHEMRGETYNGLVRLIKPGCRTVLLLLDADTKEILIRKFQRCVWPYRKNKSLQFGFMHVDRPAGLSWYKQLLQLSLVRHETYSSTLNINPRNCVGTVISLNGHRKYFCVFHASVTMPGNPNRRRANSGYRNGAFLGFDSENSSDEQSDVERGGGLNNDTSDTPEAGILFTNHLLDNLSNWLDRLFEGSTHRYHINYWPDFPLK
ncbi:dnaJ homolog subfamily C member 16 [Folsomia candida]|uniref:dnaJ homolog subfamily C member 16 n=1 Tax=Folsomia candida TaxID=158441 RepID=UPI000B8F5B18|nr:dnaJ homolog subfamily C member 16 [Folsomia candida]